MRRVLPAVATFLLAIAVLAPGLRTVPQHGDEGQYMLSAAYFGGKVARLDFRPRPGGDRLDPGWDPSGYWALTQPMGARFIYALAMGLTGAPAPTRAWDYHGDQPADTMVPPVSLPIVRLAAVLCAALGLALVALRLGWRGTAAAALLLLIPHARDDLTRAWAEGPLLLGLGLCTVAFGTRWFGVACGLAATAKLTAVGLWPMLLWPRATGARPWSIAAGALGATLTWTLLTPPAWFVAGPLYLPFMLLNRSTEYAFQSSQVGQPGYGGAAGFFLPTRYLVPLELVAALLLTSGIAWLWQHRPVWRGRYRPS